MDDFVSKLMADSTFSSFSAPKKDVLDGVLAGDAAELLHLSDAEFHNPALSCCAEASA